MNSDCDAIYKPRFALSVRQPWSDDKDQAAAIVSSLAADGFGFWLAGFIDGEGCFIIHKKAPSKTYFQCWFNIKLRKDDRAILEEIARRTHIGFVRDRKREDRSKPQAEWIVRRKHELPVLIAILTAYPLRAKKKRDFAIWKQAVALYMQIRHLPSRNGGRGSVQHPNQPMIGSLKEELSTVRKYVCA